MTRKLTWRFLLCFAQLSTLPGCLHLPYLSKSYWESTTKVPDPAKVNPADGADFNKSIQDRSGFSTSNLRGEPPNGIAKSLSGPGQSLETRGMFLEDQPEKAITKKSSNVLTGVVTVESAGEPKRLAVQVPALPLIENKREDALWQAVKSLLEKRHDEAIQYLRVYDKETQEIFLCLVPALTLLAQKPFNELSPQEIAVLHDQLLSARERLRPRCELLVSKMCFCKEVRGFGWYKPLPENHAFVTGTKDRLGEEVQLYVELKNFLSAKTKDGDYLTKLTCTLELQDSTGKKVWSHTFDGSDATHRRSAQLNDLYRNFTFYVPPLPPGTYQLTMQIADETNRDQRRVASEKLIFRVTPAVN